MGFTTGLLGGLTLTTALIHISLSIHARNRIAQSAHLHQQSLILNRLVDGPPPPLPAAAPRVVQAGVWETAKDRWNAELEGNVKKLQSTDWNGVRDQIEEVVSRTWRRAFQKGREGIVEVVGK
ncbi:hypothetical protein LTR29_001434 [Friedmanniomyces endolithicus]|nr:hypothetical protein LTR29_001434 [Friedmanniomyces endolithicus]